MSMIPHIDRASPHGATTSASRTITAPRDGFPFPSGFLDAIDRAVRDREGRSERGEVRFRCPAPDHEDRHPSARWNRDKATWHCDACGTGGGVLDLGDRLNVPLPERPAPRPAAGRGGVAERYDYVDRDGRLLFQVERLAPKAFRQRRPDGNGGWAYNLRGIEPVLYRLDALTATDETIVVVEGEKDADRLHALGIVATTAPMGAGKWRESYTETLAGREIVIVPDNDEPGQRHAEQVATQLHAAGCAVRVAALPGVLARGDVSDWFDLGFTSDDFVQLIAETSVWAPAADDDAELSAAFRDEVPAERNGFFVSAREFAEQTPATTDWVAARWVARNAITEVSGKIKAAGKTTWVLALCRAVLEGAQFLGRTAAQGPIVYMTEQPQASFREALDRAGLLDADDLHILQWHKTAGIPWPDVVEVARRHAREVGAVLLVIDTLGQFAGLRGDSENDAGAALEAIAPLQQALADDLGILILRHDRKGGGEVGVSARGSSAFGGAVDVVLQIQRAEGNSRPTLRVINALSRFSATPDQLMIELTDDGYRALGDKTAVALDEAGRAIIAIAPTAEVDAVTEKDLLEATGIRRTVGQDALRHLIADNVIARLGEGKRGDPYRYWRPGEKLSAATSSLDAAESNDRLPADGGKVSAGTPGVAAESNGHAEAAILDAGFPATCRMVETCARVGPCWDASGPDCRTEVAL